MPTRKTPRRTAFKESDLYMPVARHFRSLGYEVKGEVSHCDLVARRGGELVVVELKGAFNLTLLIQAIKRQGLTHAVYVAIPLPKAGRWGKEWREMKMILRRLGLGLVTVASGTGPAADGVENRTAGPAVRVEFDPGPFTRRLRPAKRRSLLKEFDGRTGDRNTGGRSTREGVLVTAYREAALRTAVILSAQVGPQSPRGIVSAGGPPNTASILQRNYHGWFRRVERGLYELTPAGRAALPPESPRGKAPSETAHESRLA